MGETESPSRTSFEPASSPLRGSQEHAAPKKASALRFFGCATFGGIALLILFSFWSSLHMAMTYHTS
jgi:hypothetical protein